jgi:hypothetical protein
MTVFAVAAFVPEADAVVCARGVAAMRRPVVHFAVVRRPIVR